MPLIDNQKSFNIILSPEFYWVKRKDLPVKSLFGAKKYATSLFEGFLPEEDEYTYLVSREDGEFIFIAFSEKYITNFLKAKDIKIEQIDKIYFAQFEKNFFAKPIYLDEQNALIEINKTATILRVDFINDETTLYPANKNYIPKGLSTQISSMSIFSPIQAYLLFALIVGYSIVNYVEGFRYSSQSEMQQNKFDDFIKKSGLPNSSYQLKNIFKKYNKLDNMERKKRDIVQFISITVMKNGGEITILEMDKEGAFIQAKSNKAKKIKIELLKKDFIENVNVEKNLLLIKAKI